MSLNLQKMSTTTKKISLPSYAADGHDALEQLNKNRLCSKTCSWYEILVTKVIRKIILISQRLSINSSGVLDPTLKRIHRTNVKQKEIV